MPHFNWQKNSQKKKIISTIQDFNDNKNKTYKTLCGKKKLQKKKWRKMEKNILERF